MYICSQHLQLNYWYSSENLWEWCTTRAAADDDNDLGGGGCGVGDSGGGGGDGGDGGGGGGGGADNYATDTSVVFPSAETKVTKM